MKSRLLGASLLVYLGYTVFAESLQPNIVVILADDMYRHHPGFNGGPVAWKRRGWHA